MGSYLGNIDTVLLSKKLNLYITPPDFFFLIWIVIFSLMGLVLIYNLFKNVFTVEVHGYLTINNIFLIVWVNLLSIKTEAVVYVCLVLIFGMLLSTAKAWEEMGKRQNLNYFLYIARNVYAFYEGWIIALFNINLGIGIKYWWGSSNGTQVLIFWVLVITLANMTMMLAFASERRRGLKSMICLWISVVWAIVGAAISSNLCLNSPSIC